MIAHGICYDFFFFTGQLYVDKRAPNDIRSSAQGFIAFVTLGVGMFIGGNVNGWWNGKQTTGTGEDAVVNWPAVWYFPAIMAAVVLVAFFILFKDNERSDAAESTGGGGSDGSQTLVELDRSPSRCRWPSRPKASPSFR